MAESKKRFGTAVGATVPCALTEKGVPDCPQSGDGPNHTAPRKNVSGRVVFWRVSRSDGKLGQPTARWRSGPPCESEKTLAKRRAQLVSRELRHTSHHAGIFVRSRWPWGGRRFIPCRRASRTVCVVFSTA